MKIPSATEKSNSESSKPLIKVERQPRSSKERKASTQKAHAALQFFPLRQGPEQRAVLAIQEAFLDRFSYWVSSLNQFHALMREIFGERYDAPVAESFRLRALRGDYQWLPKIEFTDDRRVRRGRGAFDLATGIVYLDRRLSLYLLQATRIYSVEVGHFLNTWINPMEGTGREAKRFAARIMDNRTTRRGM